MSECGSGGELYPEFTSGLVYTFRGAEGGEKVERADWPLLSQLVMVSRRDLQLSSRQLSQATCHIPTRPSEVLEQD